MKYISCTDTFKARCDDVIASIDSTSVVAANKMMLLAARVCKKYPFVFLPDFIEDFMNGMFTREMSRRYQVISYNDFAMLTLALQLQGLRSKSPDSDNMKINLSNTKWKKQHDFLKQYLPIFDNALMELYNCNILHLLVSDAVLNLQYIDNRDLSKNVLESYKKFKQNTSLLYNNKLRDSFEEYLHNDLAIKLDYAVEYLTQESYITSLDGDVSLPQKYSTISDNIYALIHETSERGISYNSLRTKILNEFPLIRMTHKMAMFDGVIDKLETEQKIIRNKSYWKYSPDSDQMFSFDNYTSKIEQIKEELASRGRTKFFGRRILPEQFLDEIKTLEIGDLDDLDDQVTRIAGLVLSDAGLLQSPRENMREFDFIVDVTNYNFRPEQEMMMKNIDFVAKANIFHCKVMINDKVTLETLTKFKNIVPPGEQCVIFTCAPVSSDVVQQTKTDRTVQIVDEQGIYNWCSITPIIPCRRHSIARVMYGDGIGKMVLVKSLNYESGLATVEIVPNRDESTFQIACLQEIDLHVSNPNDFESASNTYFDFLCLLADLSPTFFEDGMSTPVIAIHETHLDLIKNTQPELFDNNHPRMFFEQSGSKANRYIQLDNTHVIINSSKRQMNNSFSCKCSHRLNEEHYYTLCKHLVAAIDHFCRNGSDWPTVESNIELFTKKLVRFQEDNIKRIIGVIHDVMEPKSQYLLKEYLQKHVDAD